MRENIDLSKEIYRDLFNTPRTVSSILSHARNEAITSMVLLLGALVLNYILFGKFTLWNRVVHVENLNEGGTIR